jgi:hypothetical protein
MFRSLAIAVLLATSAAANPFAAKQTPTDSKSAYMSKLLKNARPTENSQLRHLDGAEEDYAVDITGFSLKFTKCQFVKSYSADLAAAGADTVLATQRFVIFRLCPSSNCKSCNYNYGEYVIDMNDYLDTTVEYRQDEQEAMCEACQETCYYEAADDAAADEDAEEEADEEEEAEDEAEEEEDNGERRRRFLSSDIDCDTCVTACQKIDNMEANYYVDATTFINCQQLQDNGDDGVALYAGPMCASQGSKIKIGVFTDEDCMYLDNSKDVEDYLADEDGNQVKVSHALLKTVYDDSECISCLADKDGDDDAAEDEVRDVCENLYEAAGKCEKDHGFSDGLDNYVQNANEDFVCDYISSLKSGTYSQDGEIVIGGSKMYTNGGTSTTGGQKFALTFFIIGTVGLAVYSAMLHSQLTKGGKADLSAQGGAMA